MGATTSKPKVSAQDKAILDLKLQRDKLHQYQKSIVHLTTHEHAVAQTALRQKNRRAALLALRRKKYQESLLSKTDTQLEQLERLASDVEFSLVQKDVYYGLKQGNDVLKAIHKEMGGVEGVEKLMGEGDREREYQKEVEELLEGKMSVEDEEKVEEELAGLEERMGVKLPRAPTEALPEREEPVGVAVEGEEPEREQNMNRTAKVKAKPAEPIPA